MISLKTILEAAVFAAGEPISLERLQSLFDDETDRPNKTEIRAALEALIEDYAAQTICLKETSSGFCFQVKTEFSPWINKLWQEKTPRQSRALLETLAIIAYRQPITRAEIEEIRGVSVSTQMIKTLLEQEWVRSVGHREVPGRPSLYATTSFFLDYFNLKNLNELPSLLVLQGLQEKNDQALKDAALGELPVSEPSPDETSLVVSEEIEAKNSD